MEEFTGGGKSQGKTEKASLVERLRAEGLHDMADEVVAFRREEDRKKRSRRRKGKASRAARRKNRRG